MPTREPSSRSRPKSTPQPSMLMLSSGPSTLSSVRTMKSRIPVVSQATRSASRSGWWDCRPTSVIRRPAAPTSPMKARALSAPRSTARWVLRRSVPSGGIAALAGVDPSLCLAAGQVSAERVRGQAARLSPAGESRPDVGVVGILEDAVGGEDVAAVLGGAEGLAVDQAGFEPLLLERHHGADHGRDLGLDVVRLIDHVAGGARGLGAQPGAEAGGDQLVEDEEQLVGVDGARDQVVVPVLAVIEVEAAQPPLVEEDGDDLLDVDAVRVVTEVDDNFGVLTGLLAEQQGHPPVLNVGVVEGRLVELVLDQQPHRRRQEGVDLGHRLLEPLLPQPEVVLSRGVGAVAPPELEGAGADGVADLAALEDVLQRPAPDPEIGVRQAAEPVILRPEGGRVDCADPP